VDDVDYLVGGMLERIIPGTLTTPSFRCVLGEGFFRYKVGDRFFYEYDISPGAFSPGKPTRGLYARPLHRGSVNVPACPAIGEPSEDRRRERTE